MKKIATKNTEEETKLSRRSFLKACGVAAAGIGLATSSLATNAVASSQKENKPQEDKYHWLDAAYKKGSHLGITIYGETQEDIDNVKTTLQYLNDMPEKLKKFGIEYNEPTRMLEKCKETQTPIYSFKHLTDNDNIFAAFRLYDDFDIPLIVVDSDDTIDLGTLAGHTFHEMNHNEQHQKNAYFPVTTGYSTTNIERLQIEVERLTSAEDGEFGAFATILAIDEKTQENHSLKELTKQAKKLLQDGKYQKSLTSPTQCIPQYSFSTSVAALNAIEENGAEAVKNLDTKKAAFETLSGRDSFAKEFTKKYKPQAKTFGTSYKNKIDKNAESNPGKPINDLISTIHGLDSRGSILDKMNSSGPDRPLSTVNNYIFDKIVLDKKGFFETLFSKNDASTIIPQPEMLAANSQPKTQSQEVFDKGFSIAKRIWNQKSGRC
ncbi:MAG: twin-arginine translocation signal domain-containing protein [Alphaproteobacteria bacterium]|nr:twin-arginine translocation signal domain-containing protein [Alphaproteobacteria bacterium]